METHPYAGSTLLSGHRVALVHEWFGPIGGSDRVFLAMTQLVPHASRYVLWAEPDAPVAGLDLRETWIARTPLRRHKPLALPVMPLVWRTMGRPGPDVVLSSSQAFAHHVRLGDPESTRHLSYVHSPARYVWSPSLDERGSHRMLDLPRRLLQSVDRRGGRHVHAYAANSHEVRARINRFWHRDATVIHPPVDVDWFGDAPKVRRGRDYLLGVGRWVPYKNFDLMIAIADAAGLPLVIAGSGPQEPGLRRAAAAAGVEVTFERLVTRERLRELYWGARALLFPTHDDFGIVPVEAQACGTPVIGLARGGVRETVVDGETGVLVDSLDPRVYAAAVPRLSELDEAKIRRNAAEFSPARFTMQLSDWLDDALR
jgi:glycosyltransferase involved in cell wall biosynthesis